MVLQSSFFDPVVGLDIHIVGVPAPPAPVPVPTPIPMPFVGLVFDPVGLAVGAAIGMAMGGGPGIVLVNSLPVTNCGTNVTNKLTMPHVPAPGVIFIPPPMPGNDAELWFGSNNVTLAGSYGVRLGDVALSCSDPVRLPTSVVLAIPKGAPVLNMPAMVPDLKAIAMALAMKAIIKGLGALVRRGAALFRRFRANSPFFQRLSRALGGCEPPAGASRWRQMWSRTVRTLTGHPIDVVTGNLSTALVDVQLPGPLPLTIERVYESAGSSKAGSLGFGWSHTLDESLWFERGRVVVRLGDGREVEFPLWDQPGRRLAVGATLSRVIHGMTLRRVADDRFELRTADRRVHVFASVPGERERLRLIELRSHDARHRITLTYDPRARLEWVRDSAGRTLRFEHDAHDRLRLIELPDASGEGRHVHRRYHHDAHGDLVAVEDSQGARWSYHYQGHLLVEEVDRVGLAYRFQYDGVGSLARCVRTWGPGGIHDHVLDYDPAARKTLVEDSLGNVTIYAYDHRNLIVAITDPVGATCRYAYDLATAKRTLERDPLGLELHMRYDARGNLIEQVGPQGTLALEYDADDHPVLARDARGGRWRWTWQQGQLVERVLPTGERTWYEWREGLVASVQDGDREAARTSLVRDDRGQIREVMLGQGSRERYEYDALGRLVAHHNPRGGVARFEYDREGRMTACTDPSGTTRRLVPDAEGNLVEVSGGGARTRYTYGHAHRVIAREHEGVLHRFEYDNEGRVVAIVDEFEQRYRFEFDPRGEVIAEIGFDGRTTRYLRDAACRVTGLIRPSGARSTMKYDSAGRLSETTHADGSFRKLEYGPDGTLVRATNESSELVIERDELGRIVSESCGGHEVRSRYGVQGWREQITSSLGAHLAIVRDALGDVRQLYFGPREGFARPQVELEYDALGLETARRFDTGLALEWRHDVAGRPLQRRTSRAALALAGAASLLAASDAQASRETVDARVYHWRGETELSAIDSLALGSIGYDHDARGRLIRERRPDQIVERAVVALGRVGAREHEPGGRLIEAAGTRYEYDLDGQRSAKIEPDGSTWRYRWTGHGLLRAVERPEGGRVEFEYDALARRIAKRTLGPAGALERETRYVWDRNVVVHELDSREGVITWHWDPDGFRLLAREHAGERHDVVTDHLGTPTEIYDRRGQLAWRMPLDLAGRRTDTLDADPQRAAKAIACPFAWPGQQVDDETGLHYNRYRYFDPTVDRYISADPLGVQPGVDLYAYVPDPLTEVDPLGLAPYNFATLLADAQNTLDFSTARDGAVFWATPNMATAQAWAAANGKTTLEQTAGGRYLDSLKLFDPSSGLTGAQAAQVWDAASRRFAEGASGTVNVFSTGARKNGPWGLRTWWRLERPTLDANPNVTGITRRRLNGMPCK